jgi:hypothetical protein
MLDDAVFSWPPYSSPATASGPSPNCRAPIRVRGGHVVGAVLILCDVMKVRV